MPPSPFAVAGMASTSGSLTHSSSLTHSHNHNQGHAPALPSWGGDLSQRASHYQPGYLMSASQAQNAPQSTDDRDARAPVVPTKAKMNQAFSMSMSGGGMSGGGSTNDGWGMDSMFQSARQRPPLADADAPPMASVNDIPMAGSANYPQQPQQQQQRTPAFGRFSSPASPPPHSRTPASPSASSFQSQSHAQGQGQAPALLIFGYPPDKYTLTLSFFAALAPLAPGAPPALAPEVAGNCFLLWYKEVGDAVRAVRKSGVVLGGGGGEGGGGSGGWMVGVRWADPAAAEALLAQPAAPRHTSPDPMMVDPEYDSSTSSSPYAQGRGGGAEYAGTVGTPLRLAPSTAAFRHSNNSGARPQAKAAAPPAQGGQAPAEAGGAGNVNANGGKGVLGQVSDMIFGW